MKRITIRLFSTDDFNNIYIKRTKYINIIVDYMIDNEIGNEIYEL